MKIEKHTMDKPLLLVVLTLLTLGIVMVYSASNVIAEQKFGSSSHFLVNQIARAMLGFIVLAIAAKYDYHLYKKHTMKMVLVAVILLIIVLALGKLKGAARWLQIGGFGIQPSELAKMALVFYIAGYLDGKGDRIKDFQNGLLPPLMIAGFVCFMIVLQPNFSTAMVLMMIVFAMLFVGGMEMKHFGMLMAGAIPLGIGLMLSSAHSRARVMAFLNPSDESLSATYQIKQSLISFANGGLAGVGVGQGKQKFLFLPEPFTDFIYSIIGEELGFLGAFAVLALFMIFLFRAIKIARTSPDMYGFYLAVGIIVSIVMYALVNAAVATGLFPTTGLPMPFISYGGTSTLFTCFAVGVLLNISAQTVPKELALRETSPEFAMKNFTENFNVEDRQELPDVLKKQEENKSRRGSIVGMDLSDLK